MTEPVRLEQWKMWWVHRGTELLGCLTQGLHGQWSVSVNLSPTDGTYVPRGVGSDIAKKRAALRLLVTAYDAAHPQKGASK